MLYSCWHNIIKSGPLQASKCDIIAGLLYWIAYNVHTLYIKYPITFKIGYLVLLPQYVMLNLLKKCFSEVIIFTLASSLFFWFCCDEALTMATLTPHCCPIWPLSVTLDHSRHGYCDPITSAQVSHNSHGNQFVSWPTSLPLQPNEYDCICWLHCSCLLTLFQTSTFVAIASSSENCFVVCIKS